MIDREEEEIILGIKQRDERIVEYVYLKHRRSFFLMLSSFKIDKSHMKDIYQESMLALCNNISREKYKPELANISTYIMGIGKYKALNFIRKRKKEQEVLKDWTPIEEFEIESTLSIYQQKLSQHFKSLGPKCREILRLFYYQGMTIKEIVELQGYNNENVVKSQKSRCLKHLKSLIKS